MNGQPARLLLATVLGAAIVFVLGGLLYLTAGLLVVGAVVGWGTGAAVRGGGRDGRIAAVAAAAVALTAGLLGAWAAGVGTGGTLGPVEFVLDVFGPVAPLLYVVAAGAAWISSRPGGSPA